MPARPERARGARRVAPEQAVLCDALLMEQAAVDEEVDREGPRECRLRLDRVRSAPRVARDHEGYRPRGRDREHAARGPGIHGGGQRLNRQEPYRLSQTGVKDAPTAAPVRALEDITRGVGCRVHVGWLTRVNRQRENVPNFSFDQPPAPRATIPHAIRITRDYGSHIQFRRGPGINREGRRGETHGLAPTATPVVTLPEAAISTETLKDIRGSRVESGRGSGIEYQRGDDLVRQEGAAPPVATVRGLENAAARGPNVVDARGPNVDGRWGLGIDCQRAHIRICQAVVDGAPAAARVDAFENTAAGGPSVERGRGPGIDS